MRTLKQCLADDAAAMRAGQPHDEQRILCADKLEAYVKDLDHNTLLRVYNKQSIKLAWWFVGGCVLLLIANITYAVMS